MPVLKIHQNSMRNFHMRLIYCDKYPESLLAESRRAKVRKTLYHFLIDILKWRFWKTSCICERFLYELNNTDKLKRQLDSMSWNNRICSYLLTDFNKRWTNWGFMLSMRPIIHRLHFLQIYKTSPPAEKCHSPRR